ncbi:hypothetical protein ACFV3R_12675 [Streptomyces sp. NPDC059740]|uniref:hypothetical protein n=1 Tax=Streptomyces sp. NPDC059740 TaxID=3346926 RepID=UPI0036669A75
MAEFAPSRARRTTTASARKRQPWWRQRWLQASLGVAVVYAASRLAFDGLSAWPFAVGGAAALAVVVAVARFRQDRHDSRSLGVPPAELPRLERYLRRRSVPETPADRQALLHMARLRERRTRRARVWAFPLMAALWLALGVLFLVLGRVAASVGFLAAGALVLLVAVGLHRWELRRMAAFREELEAGVRSADGEATGSANGTGRRTGGGA